MANNTLVLAIGQFSSKFLGIIMMNFYTTVLGTDGYGAVGLIVDTSVLIMAVVTLSVGESTIRFGLDAKTDKSQVFSISLTTNLAGLLIYIPFIPLLGLVDIISDYTFLIYLYVFTASIRSTCALFVRSAGHIRLFAIDGIYNTTINIILNLIMLHVFKLGVVGYVLSIVLADLASIIFLFFMADLKKYLRFFGLNKRLRAAMYRFCIPMIPTTVMWWVTNASDTYFVSIMMGEGSYGIYNAAYKLPNIIALVSGIFSQAWNMSAITEKNSRTIAKFYTEVFNFFSSVIYCVAAGMLLIVRPALQGFLAPGEDFTDAYLYSPFIIMAVLFTCFSTFMGSMYIAAKKSVKSMVTAASGAVLNLILNALFIPVIGLYGAGLSTMLAYILIFFIRVADTRSIVFMDLKPVKMTANLILLSGMCIIVILVKDDLIYYGGLSAIFVMVAAINYRAGIAALNFILKNKKKNKDIPE